MWVQKRFVQELGMAGFVLAVTLAPGLCSAQRYNSAAMKNIMKMQQQQTEAMQKLAIQHQIAMQKRREEQLAKRRSASAARKAQSDSRHEALLSRLKEKSASSASKTAIRKPLLAPDKKP